MASSPKASEAKSPKASDSKSPKAAGAKSQQASFEGEPRIPENISISMLSREIRQKISTVDPDTFENLGMHIISTQFLLDTNPKLAFEHAKCSMKLAANLDIVHELMGICAYRLGLYKLALREFTISRKINSSNDFIPMIIDCYRGLNQLGKAAEIARRFNADMFEDEIRTEYNIILASTKADVGEAEDGLGIINKELRQKGLSTMERVRLFEAKSEIFHRVGRVKEAEEIERKVGPLIEKLEKVHEESFTVYDLKEEDKTDEDFLDDITEPRVEGDD